MTEIQRRILKEEYPTMSLDGDLDIERYFEMRKQGRQADALAFYNGRLRKKYPNDAVRERLLRYYRVRDPRYAEILHESMIDLAERLVTRVTYVIGLLTKDIDSVDMSDAYSVIKLAEGLLSVISPDRYVAISFTEKYVRYAKALGYRAEAMERTAELIRLYVTDALESVQDFKKDREERRRQRARQAERQRHDQRPGFDLSRIVFGAEDLRRIQIPQTVTRTEDVVIAYCVKYWNLTSDPAFEKTVFLYSRKYRTNHHDIFQAIKNGRDHGWKDEEILNAVLANVVTGYYYSISGDVYLQRAWARYKATIDLGAAPDAKPVPALPAPLKPPAKTTRARKSKAPAEKTKASTRKAAAAPNARKLAAKPEKTRATAITRATRDPRIAEGKTRVKPFAPEAPAVARRKPKLPQVPAFRPNSVADMIRTMTGKTYTVYKDLFFREIRPSIRTVLASSRSRKGLSFGGRQNDAEEILYDFLHEHYDDPYQNWKESSERKAIEELGYAVPALEPVIAEWISEKK
jgi:hypothetical protein